MNHRQTVQAVARHLPHIQRHTIAEVLEVTGEVWAQELAQPGRSVTLINLGKLHVQAQQMRVSGAIRQRLIRERGTAPDTTRRLYYRFRPSRWLKQRVEEAHEKTPREEK